MRPAMNQTRRLLGDKKNLTGIEVGVFKGEHLAEIFREYGDCVDRMFAVDWYTQGGPEYADFYIEAQERTKGWQDRVEWLIGRSDEMCNHIEDDSVDFAYLDGGHTYDVITVDIENYWKKIKSGGVLCGHDYQKRWKSVEGVVQAVDEFVIDNNLALWVCMGGSSSDWVVHKI